ALVVGEGGGAQRLRQQAVIACRCAIPDAVSAVNAGIELVTGCQHAAGGEVDHLPAKGVWHDDGGGGDGLHRRSGEDLGGGIVHQVEFPQLPVQVAGVGIFGPAIKVGVVQRRR